MFFVLLRETLPEVNAYNNAHTRLAAGRAPETSHARPDAGRPPLPCVPAPSKNKYTEERGEEPKRGRGKERKERPSGEDKRERQTEEK